MRLSRRKFAVAAPVLATISVLTIAATTPSARQIARAKARAEAQAWIEQHANALPKTFEGIGSLPMTYRKEVVLRLSVSEQGMVWRQQLMTYVTADAELTSMQRQMVQALDKPLTDSQRTIVRMALDSLGRIFDSTLSLKDRQAVALIFCDKSKKLFTPTQAALIFGLVGPVDQKAIANAQVGKASLGLVDVVDVTRRVLQRLHVARTFDVCNCDRDTACSDCGIIQQDPCDETTCLPTPLGGCGCFNVFSCNGTCGS